MIKLFTVFYAIFFTIAANCFILFDSAALIALCLLAFVILNIFCGLKISRSKSRRLRFLCHGTILLVSFCVSFIPSILLHILALTGVTASSKLTLIFSVICCVLCNAIIFWNGIISTYLTSVQLGIKLRIEGITCGWIIILNLIFLGKITSKTYSELIFETKKEKLNARRKDDRVCQTKYPVLLVHGVFFRDNKLLNYWGRIPKELELNGAVCHYGNHQSASSVKESGEELSERIKEIVKETGCEKLNIIAHSKGGLDCRYAIENCDVADCVASLTTINTPHRGCLFAEWLLTKAPKTLKTKVSDAYNSAAKLFGDKEPDFLSAVNDLKADACKKFDSETPIPDNIYTQSVGSVMKKAEGGKFPLNYSYYVVKLFDGKNDGLAGVDSFEWGSKYTLLEPKGDRGISHADMIDLNRENIKGFDVREFYVQLVSELKERGL